MKRSVAGFVGIPLLALLSAPLHAEPPRFGYVPTGPVAPFVSALSPEELERESVLNTAPDGVPKKAGRKEDATTKATVTIFGNVTNNAGAAVCGLVLANGQFMFSCSPNGTYSLTVPQDGAGQVTLFGFADGHFPYRLVFGGSGGRYDMRLNVATTQPPPPPPPPQTSVLRWTIEDGCNNGIQIEYKFYDFEHNWVWPSATTHYYTEYFGARYTHNLECQTGANICLGARSSNLYWGVDRDGSRSCTSCCRTCQNASVSDRLTC